MECLKVQLLKNYQPNQSHDAQWFIFDVHVKGSQTYGGLEKFHLIMLMMFT